MNKKSALAAVVVAFLVGLMVGVVVVESYASTYPHFFCRPLADGSCDPFPWRHK